MRALAILKDVRLGVGPDWPADLALLARHYDGLPDSNRRREALKRIADALKERAAPFLLAKMAGKRFGPATIHDLSFSGTRSPYEGIAARESSLAPASGAGASEARLGGLAIEGERRGRLGVFAGPSELHGLGPRFVGLGVVTRYCPDTVLGPAGRLRGVPPAGRDRRERCDADNKRSSHKHHLYALNDPPETSSSI